MVRNSHLAAKPTAFSRFARFGQVSIASALVNIWTDSMPCAVTFDVVFVGFTAWALTRPVRSVALLFQVICCVCFHSSLGHDCFLFACVRSSVFCNARPIALARSLLSDSYLHGQTQFEIAKALHESEQKRSRGEPGASRAVDSNFFVRHKVQSRACSCCPFG